MAKKVVAIVGTYRKGGAVDTLVDAVLDGARERGAETSKVYLVDEHIEYCRNCRTCTQQPGDERGKCAIEDDMQKILAEVDAADVVVLASPVNFYNVTAVYRKFLERLLGATYWPWGQWAPKPRWKTISRKAVLISTSSAPGFFIPLATGAVKALRISAKCLGAKPVAALWIGLTAREPKPELSERVLARAHRVGLGL